MVVDIRNLPGFTITGRVTWDLQTDAEGVERWTLSEVLPDHVVAVSGVWGMGRTLRQAMEDFRLQSGYNAILPNELRSLPPGTTPETYRLEKLNPPLWDDPVAEVRSCSKSEASPTS